MKVTYGTAVDQIIAAAGSVDIEIGNLTIRPAYEGGSIEVIPSGTPVGSGPAREILRALAATNLRVGAPYPIARPEYGIVTGHVPALGMDVAVIHRLKPGEQ
jgi:hypothetical protein